MGKKNKKKTKKRGILGSDGLWKKFEALSPEVFDRMRDNLPNLPPPFARDRISGEDAERLLDAPLIAFRFGGGGTKFFGRVRSVETGRLNRATIHVRVLPDGHVEQITPKQVTHILALDSFGDIAAPVEVGQIAGLALGIAGTKSVADEMIEQGLLQKETCIYSAYLMMWVDSLGRVTRFGITSEDSLHISRVGDGSIPVTMMEVRAETFHAAQHALAHIWHSELQVYLDPERRLGSF